MRNGTKRALFVAVMNAHKLTISGHGDSPLHDGILTTEYFYVLVVIMDERTKIMNG